MELMPLTEYCKKYPWPKIHTLRWIIHKTQVELGKKPPFITKFGKRILIDPKEFLEWVKSQEGCETKRSWIEKDKQKKLTKSSS